MNSKELQSFYKNLPRQEKGMFLACLTLLTGSTPESWKNKLMGRTKLVLPPPMQHLIGNFVTAEEWKQYVQYKGKIE